MIFKTEFSTYEVDAVNNLIRRLEGVNDPTPNQGPDGEWKSYSHLHPFHGRYYIEWTEGGGTTTSVVQEIIE